MPRTAAPWAPSLAPSLTFSVEVPAASLLPAATAATCTALACLLAPRGARGEVSCRGQATRDLADQALVTPALERAPAQATECSCMQAVWDMVKVAAARVGLRAEFG